MTPPPTVTPDLIRGPALLSGPDARPDDNHCITCFALIGHAQSYCNDCRAEQYDDFDDDEPEMSEDEEFLEYHCGWMPGGGCSMAGTEDCDWSCPRTRQQVKARIERQRAKEKPLPLFPDQVEHQP